MASTVISLISTAHTNVQPPHYQHLLQSATLVTIDKFTLLHHRHPKSIVYIRYIRVYSWWCTSLGVDKCIKTHVHHYSAIHSCFTALKILCAPPVGPSPSPLATTDLFTASILLPSKMSYSWNHTLCRLFRLTF